MAALTKTDPAYFRALEDAVEMARLRELDTGRAMVRDGLEVLIELHSDYDWVEAIITVTLERLPKRIT
jgi:hypothetical protein